jgi:hypothetical protein
MHSHVEETEEHYTNNSRYLLRNKNTSACLISKSWQSTSKKVKLANPSG